MKILVVGDLHIIEEDIPEISLIINEIMSYDADILISLGDYYHKKHPSTIEIKEGTFIAKKLKDRYKQVVILNGNLGQHGDCGGYTNVDYLTSLGITIVPNFTIENFYFAHGMVELSKMAYGKNNFTLDELLKLEKIVVLGHQHSPQEIIKNRIIHLGSCRYVNGGEVEDLYKFIGIIENNEINFKKLHSIIPAIRINNIKDLKKLEEDNPSYKVYYNFSSFNQVRDEIEYVNKIKSKFYKFKCLFNFEERSNEIQVKKSNLKEIIIEWLDKIKNNEVKILLKNELKDLIV